MQRRIDRLENHFIVCRYGRVGRAVARELESEHAPFSVVEREEDLVEQMEADGVPHVFDDATREPALRRAGVERARGLVCAVDSDATNVYIALVARGLNPELFIVARASEPGSDQRLLAAGADRVVTVRVWPAHGPRRDAPAGQRRRGVPDAGHLHDQAGADQDRVGLPVRRPGGARRLRRGARPRRPSRRRPDHRQPAPRCEAPGGGHRAGARGGGPHLGRPGAASRG